VQLAGIFPASEKEYQMAPPVDWSLIGAAPIFERGNYFNNGHYKLRLLRGLSKETQKSGIAFITEFEVLESDNPAHPIGSKGTWFVKMGSLQDKQIGSSNILEMMAALLGFDIKNRDHLSQIDQQLRPQLAGLMTALETQGPAVLGGRETVSVECRTTLTKRNTEFTLHAWSPWTPPPGWQPVPTPAVAAMPQRAAAQPAVAPQGYPQAYTPPVYAQPSLPQQQPAFAPAPQQAPQQPAFVPAPQVVQAPYGQPAMPQAGVLPPWMGPPR
jgi:hypothetical protein